MVHKFYKDIVVKKYADCKKSNENSFYSMW